MQRISGPVSGVFIASYAMPHPQGFLGYSKLCLVPPDDVWNCAALRKVVGGLAASKEEALDNAELQALSVIAALDVLRSRYPNAPDERLIRSAALSRIRGNVRVIPESS